MFINKICVCVYLTFYVVFWEIIFYPIEMQQILPIETFLLDKTFQIIFFRKMTSGIMVRSQSFLLYWKYYIDLIKCPFSVMKKQHKKN